MLTGPAEALEQCGTFMKPYWLVVVQSAVSSCAVTLVKYLRVRRSVEGGVQQRSESLLAQEEVRKALSRGVWEEALFAYAALLLLAAEVLGAYHSARGLPDETSAWRRYDCYAVNASNASALPLFMALYNSLWVTGTTIGLPWSTPLIAAAVLLFLPVFFTHTVPAVVAYGWLYLPALGAFFCSQYMLFFGELRLLVGGRRATGWSPSRRAFVVALPGLRRYVTWWRDLAGTFFFTILILLAYQTGANWVTLLYSGESYAGVFETEWNARRTSVYFHQLRDDASARAVSEAAGMLL